MLFFPKRAIHYKGCKVTCHAVMRLRAYSLLHLHCTCMLHKGSKLWNGTIQLRHVVYIYPINSTHEEIERNTINNSIADSLS